jgi:flagellar biosynthetic protein FliR
VPHAFGPAGIGVVVIREAVIGLSLAFGVRALIAAAELAGYLVGFQIGFTYATVADPQTGARNNVLSSLFGLIALVAFFVTNGHHDMLRALALSYEALPIGAGALDGSLALLVAQILGVVFSLAAQIAAPVVIVLLMAELGLGLVSRAAPSFNLMAHGSPVRVTIGMIALILTLRVLPVAIRSGIPGAMQLGARLAEAFR